MKNKVYVAQLSRLVSLLREIRIEAGLTQVELAMHIGRDQTFVSKYERGQRRLDVLEVREICQVVGISLEEFVKRLEKALK